MGVVNVTPDSFSDGGLYLDPEAAVRHGVELVEAGAAILDVGGESTRPGAEEVPAEEELRRVVPVVEGLAGVEAEISVDTSKAAVAAAALDAGAGIVNDVTALRGDPEMAGLCAEREATVVLMHMAGSPRTMQNDPVYEDVVAEVREFLAARMEAALALGSPRSGSGSIRASASARPPPTTWSCCGACPSSPSWAGPWSSAPRARASSAASTAPRRTNASAARSPPRSSPPPRAPRCCASTMSPRSARR